jgi:hypothetical protein
MLIVAVTQECAGRPQILVENFGVTKVQLFQASLPVGTNVTALLACSPHTSFIWAPLIVRRSEIMLKFRGLFVAFPDRLCGLVVRVPGC